MNLNLLNISYLLLNMQIMKYYIIIHNTSILIYTLPIGCASCTLRWLSWQYFGIEMFPCIATFRVASSADRAGGYAVEARTWQHLCCPWARYVSALMCSVPCLSNTAYPCEKIKAYDIVYHNQIFPSAPPNTNDTLTLGRVPPVLQYQVKVTIPAHLLF